MSTGTGTVTPTITCNDDALVTATMTADDGINTPVTSAPTTISVMNVGPVIGPVNLSPVSVPLGGTVNLTVAFTDAGTNDTHPIASVNWGFAQGSSTPVITESGGSGSATASHVYNNGTGTFTVKVLIGDDDLDTASRTATVTVT
jgi:hypothetical protein